MSNRFQRFLDLFPKIARLWTLQKTPTGTQLPDGPVYVSAKLPDLDDSAPIVGYGPVNHAWNMSHETLTQILTRMQQKDVRYFPMECVGNGEEDVLGSETKTAKMKSNIVHIATECHKRGIWFAPILVNGNIGNGRYKNGTLTLDKRLAQIYALIDWFAHQQFQPCTIITPVGEPRGDLCAKIQNYSVTALSGAGYRLCSNEGDRPQANAAWSQDFVYHPVNTNDWPTSHKGHVLSDTGAILAQLNVGNNINGLGNPTALKTWAAHGVAIGQKVTAYYAFQTTGYDQPAIDAIGVLT